MKNEKKLHGFSYDKNIANFESFCRDKNFSKNLLFLRSEQLFYCCNSYLRTAPLTSALPMLSLIC